MTDPFARLIQKQAVKENRSDDPFERLIADIASRENPMSGEYSPPQPEIYKSFGRRVAELPITLGKSMLESINIAPEIFGGEPIPLRTRASRAFNLVTLPLPLTAPFKLAKFAPAGIRALAAGAGTAGLAATSAAIEGAPIVERGAAGGLLGAGLEAALTAITRRRVGSGMFKNAATWADPANTPFHNSKWAIVSGQRTGATSKLAPAGNVVKHAELGDDLRRLGYDPIEVEGYAPAQSGSERSYLIHGINEADAIDVARRYNQDAVLTEKGLYDFKNDMLYPIDRSNTKFDNAVDKTKDTYTEMNVGGTPRQVAIKFGNGIPFSPKQLGYRSKFVQYEPDDPTTNDAIPLAAKLRLMMTKVMKSTIGAEHFEDTIGASKYAAPEELPSLLARWDTSGLAEDAVNFGGVHSLKDRTTPIFAKSLKTLLQPIKGNELEAFEDYLIARRALALDDLSQVKPGPRLTPTERQTAEQFVNDADLNSPSFRQTADDVYGWRNAQLEWLVDAKIFTKDEIEWIKLNSPDYVPFREVRAAKSVTDTLYEPGELFFVSQPLERLKSLNLDPKAPPLEQMAKESFEWARVAKRGQVMSSFVNLLESLGPDLASQFATPIGRRTLTTTSGDELSQVLGNLRPPRKMSKQPLVVSGLVNRVDETGRQVTDRVWYEMRDPALAEMFHTLNPPEVSLFTKIMSSFASVLRAGATLSLEFMARNPIRDVLFGKVTSGAFMRDFATGLAHSFKMDDVFQQAQRSGVFKSELVAEDMMQVSNIVRKMVDAPIPAKDKLMDLVKSPLHVLQQLSLGMERGTRVGRYQRVFEDLVKSGMPVDRAALKAALAARDVSVDFGVYGSRTTALRLITAFWNAQIQGYRRLAESFSENPIGVSARAIGYITIPSILLYLHNRNDPEYFQLPSWERTIFWHVKVGDKWMRIPKPFELGVVFGSSVERMLESVDKIDPSRVDQFAGEYLSRVGSDIVPVPTAARPFVENILNHSLLRNRPIVSAAMRDVAPGYQVQPGTSHVSAELGRMFNVSPAKIDNIFYGYTAGLGRLGTQLAGGALDLGEAMFSSERELKHLAPSFDPRDLPGIRGLVSQFPRNAEPIDKLYAFADKARESAETADMLERTLRIDDLLEWVEKRAELIGANEQLAPILTALAQLRAQRAQIMEDKSLSPREKRSLFDEYDRQMLDIATSAYEAFKPFEQEQ